MKQSFKLGLVAATLLFQSFTAYSQWTSRNSGTTEDLTAMKFVNGTTGFACGGYNTILKTSDGGISWQSINSSGIPPATFMSIDALSSSKIFVARNGLYVTENGGSSWSQWGSFNSSAYSIGSIKAINDSTAFITKGGYILKTANRGQTWDARYYDMDLVGPMQFTGNNDTAYAASGKTFDGVSYGSIHKSTDGGNTWSDLAPGSRQVIAMYFMNSSTGYYAEFGNILHKTTDGGLSWSAMSSPVPADSDYITNIHFVNDMKGYLTTQNGFIYKTINAGLSWTVDHNAHKSNGAFDTFLFGMTSAGNGSIVCFGGLGTILRNDSPTPVPETGGQIAKIYPNPVTHDLFIQPGKEGSYERLRIYDMTGKMICERTMDGRQLIVVDMQQHSIGTYMIELWSGNKSYHYKFLKQ